MHLTGAEMTAWALVHLFLALILNKYINEGTNYDFNNSSGFENLGGASQRILGNPANLLLDPSGINSTHPIWKSDLDRKKCETSTETADLPAPSVPYLILHEIYFITSFFSNIPVHWRALPFNTGGGSLWVPKECTHTPDRWISKCKKYKKNTQGTGRNLSLSPHKHKIWTQDLWNEHQEDPHCPAIPDIGVSVLVGISVERKECKSIDMFSIYGIFYGSGEVDHLMERTICLKFFPPLYSAKSNKASGLTLTL